METAHLPHQHHTGKKAGRPVKCVKRSYSLGVWVTETEGLLIEGKAREAGMSISSWLRAAAKKAEVIARLSPEEVAALRMLTGLANDLHQLAQRDELLSQQGNWREVLDRINHTLQYIGRDDRKGVHR